MINTKSEKHGKEEKRREEEERKNMRRGKEKEWRPETSSGTYIHGCWNFRINHVFDPDYMFSFHLSP